MIADHIVFEERVSRELLPHDRTIALMHIAEETLELLALGRLPERDLSDAEEHLLICEGCRERLEAMDRFTAALRAATMRPAESLLWWQLHATADGPVQIWVERTDKGRYLSRRVGAHIDGGAERTSEADAVYEAMRSFAEMFPEHCCSKACLLEAWGVVVKQRFTIGI
ncbi:MAG: hypothetical protein ABSH47_27310 [Bryobacteraceae bacterium]|jgi:hypothetical protein